MKIQTSISVLALACLLCGCQHETSIPADSFQLTVREVISDSDIKVSVLDIRAPREANISVDGEGFHSDIALPESPPGQPREGEVFLSGIRIAPSQDKSAYIQTLIRPRARGVSAGGAKVHSVPTDTTLAAFFSFTAESGVYRLDSPINIVQLRGKPVTLVVGRPTK
jgi:hypothetical protein